MNRFLHRPGWLLTALTLLASGCETERTGTEVVGLRPGLSFGKLGPIAEFQDVVIDLGTVPLRNSEDTLKAEIRVQNRGDEPLAFQQIAMSCGCTSATPRQQQVNPGETGVIDVQIRVAEPGSKSVTVTVHSNTVGRPATTVSIRWIAEAPIFFEPGEVNFGAVKAGTRSEATVRLVQSKLGECAASDISLTDGFPTPAGLNSAQAAGVAAEWAEPLVLRVHLRAGDKPGQFKEFVPLELSNCWRNIVRLPVRWEVLARISVVPESVFISSIVPGQSVEHSIVISTTEPSLEVPEWDDLKTSIGPESVVKAIAWERINEQKLKGVVTLAAPEQTGVFHENVSIPVLSPIDSPNLELRLSGYVSDQRR